jgi:hypothetical protein
MNMPDFAREICDLQHRMGRLESTLFVHTPINTIDGKLFNFLVYLKYLDGGKTFTFTPSGRVRYNAFRHHAEEWILTHYDAPHIDWGTEHESLQYFGLYIDGDDLVGLSYE